MYDGENLMWTTTVVGHADIAVSANGFDFVGAFVTYIPVATVSSIYPVRGTQIGGTEVTVTGLNFVDSPTLNCRWGDGRTSTRAGDVREMAGPRLEIGRRLLG